MKILNQILWSVSIGFLFIISSCESPTNSDNDNENDPPEFMESTYNDDDSHNAGQNCMSCHAQGGEGEGIFTVAGTVYYPDLTTPYPNCDIILYKTNLVDKIYTLKADAYGNFYTTASLDLSDSCMPVVSKGTSISQMTSSTNSGNCNGCHEISTDRVFLE